MNYLCIYKLTLIRLAVKLPLRKKLPFLFIWMQLLFALMICLKEVELQIFITNLKLVYFIICFCILNLQLSIIFIFRWCVAYVNTTLTYAICIFLLQQCVVLQAFESKWKFLFLPRIKKDMLQAVDRHTFVRYIFLHQNI